MILRKVGVGAFCALCLGAMFTAKGGDWQSLLRDIGLGQTSSPTPAVSTQHSDTSKSEDEALSNKLQPFIGCINRVDTALRDAYDKYGKSYDALLEKKQSVYPTFKITVYETDNQFSRECAANLVSIRKSAPADAQLDEIADIYSGTLEKLIPIMNDADNYYRQENYVDDAMAKGRDLHAQLVPLFGTLFETSDKMRSTVEARNLALTANSLTAIEKESGRDFQWHQTNNMYRTRLALNELEKLVTANTLTSESLEPIEKALQVAFDDAKAYAQKNSNAKTPLGNKPMWFYIESKVENVLTAFKTVRRNLSAGKTDISTDLDSVAGRFNDLVRDYNQRLKNGG